MDEWNIQSRARVCCSCGQPFADGQPYHTLLFDDKPRFRRHDICELCWRKEDAAGVRNAPGFVSRWQGVYETPPQKPDQMYRETAESLLRKLIELGDTRYQPASYILAVMLERKRILKVRDQFVRDGRRVFVYEHHKSGDLFTIADPELRLDQLEHVQHQVADLLEHGLPQPQEQPHPSHTAPCVELGTPDVAQEHPPTAQESAAQTGADAVRMEPAN